MMTLRNYPPVTGPFRRRLSWLDVAVNVTGMLAIGVLLAVSVIGMTGALDEAQACVECQERMSK